MRSKALGAVVGVALLISGCGGDGANDPSAGPSPSVDAFNTPFADSRFYPVFASSEVVVGVNRFLIGLLNQNDAPVGSPGLEVEASFFNLEKSSIDPEFTTDTEFVWQIRPIRGLYVADVTFDSPGRWGAELVITGRDFQETVRSNFEVAKEGTTPEIGEKVPASDTPTADEVKKLETITTDPHPDRRFYESSIAEAVRGGEPFVVVFATPKFCTSQVCGPALDITKEVAEGYPDLTFIHVEVYSNLDDPSNLELVPAVEEWGLPSEPWVFVVDSGARLAAKFEGSASPGELRAAIKRLR